MKRYLVLEYRIGKLENAVLEDIDSDLDKMSDDILKRMPNNDLDAELDKMAKDIIGYDNKKYEFDTIEDWLDSMVFNLDLNNDNIVKVLNDRLKDVSLNFAGGPIWYTSVNRLRKSIKEISDISLHVAQQKLVNALRKKIRDIKNRKQLESLTYEGKQDQEILNDFLYNLVK